MLLRRMMEHVRTQNWLAVFLDFVIVVVGVFIGIQVSNWNEARSLQDREKTYLQQLLIDLEGDMETAERGVVSANQIDAAALILLTALEEAPGADDITDAELVAAVPLAGYAYLPFGNDTTYNEMISTGALGLLDDVELKRAFGQYYSWLETARQWDDLLREEQYAYRAAIRGILTREQFAWARANVLTPHEGAPPPAFDREDFLARARARPAMADSLRSMGTVQERLRTNSRDMGEYAARIAAQVEEAMED